MLRKLRNILLFTWLNNGVILINIFANANENTPLLNSLIKQIESELNL